jgi:hypothetical protein
MRRVTLYRYDCDDGQSTYTKVPDQEAWFRGWTLESVVFNNGPELRPVAIVELDNGAIKTVVTELVKFNKPPHRVMTDGRSTRPSRTVDSNNSPIDQETAMNEKRAVIIRSDGREQVLLNGPESYVYFRDYEAMRNIVGGPPEFTKVLRQDLSGYVFTFMVVHESGVVDGLPRNQRATDLYLANARRQFPDADNPSRALREAWIAQFPKGAVIDTSPPGYSDDPYIAGDVIWFDGWECEELDRLAFGDERI